MSLFDGMACGRIALERAGIKVKAYYAAEIDKHAMKVAKHNWPDIVHIGDVTRVGYLDGVLYNDTDSWYIGKVDLIIGGSPCQGFSFAGKQLNFEDPRSKLFFEFVRLREETAADFFLLENVKMKAEFIKIIDLYLNTKSNYINSASFSAHNRPRLYWTNFQQPLVDTHSDLVFSDIVCNDVREEHYIKNSYALTLKTKPGIYRWEELYNKLRKPIIDITKPILISEVTGDTPSGKSRQSDRLYSSKSKHPCLTTAGYMRYKVDMGSNNPQDWRYITIAEAEVLQTLPIGYTKIVSEQKGFEMLGNGWTVDVIAHIFKGLPYAV